MSEGFQINGFDIIISIRNKLLPLTYVAGKSEKELQRALKKQAEAFQSLKIIYVQLKYSRITVRLTV